MSCVGSRDVVHHDEGLLFVWSTFLLPSVCADAALLARITTITDVKGTRKMVENKLPCSPSVLDRTVSVLQRHEVVRAEQRL